MAFKGRAQGVRGVRHDIGGGHRDDIGASHAPVIGANAALRPDDYLITTYRGVHDQLAKGLHIEDKPSLKRAISAMPISKTIRLNAPNSVFALGNAFSKL